MKVLTMLTFLLASRFAYGDPTFATNHQETTPDAHFSDFPLNSSTKKVSFIDRLVQTATVTEVATTTTPSTIAIRTRKSKMLVRIKAGNHFYKVDCEPFCQRTSLKRYVVNCNRLKQPLFGICAFCRLRYRCGTSDQVFS